MTELAGIRILVLDDEPVTLVLMERMLANLGFTNVRTFDRGERALAWIAGSGQAVDLIVLDLNMPGMDGVEFLRNLVELNFAGGVILASGEDEPIQQAAETLIKAHRIPALGHLHKPVRPDSLSALINQWRPGSRSPRRGAARAYASEDVARAIANREFVNHYQPVVAVATGAVIGVETLVRWQHPADGMIYPDRFISVAEEHGHIDGLTQIVLDGAISQARSWLDAGRGLRVSVNISTDNLTTLAFPDVLARQVARAGLPASDIVLEITESRLMPKVIAVLDVLTRLRLKRFRLSIDDFGTGHSSLAQLRDIPFDELKVDRGFVHGAAGNEKKRAICDASLRLARQLDITVVAEGVEDSQDWQFLRQRGCDYAQGYFIARPMPGPELPAWIDWWSERVRAGL
jgi:EAL domain-containing protein (putative c-di-GMP-specific phosphodiesterase class I)